MQVSKIASVIYICIAFAWVQIPIANAAIYEVNVDIEGGSGNCGHVQMNVPGLTPAGLVKILTNAELGLNGCGNTISQLLNGGNPIHDLSSVATFDENDADLVVTFDGE